MLEQLRLLRLEQLQLRLLLVMIVIVVHHDRCGAVVGRRYDGFELGLDVRLLLLALMQQQRIVMMVLLLVVMVVLMTVLLLLLLMDVLHLHQQRHVRVVNHVVWDGLVGWVVIRNQTVSCGEDSRKILRLFVYKNSVKLQSSTGSIKRIGAYGGFILYYALF